MKSHFHYVFDCEISVDLSSIFSRMKHKDFLLIFARRLCVREAFLQKKVLARKLIARKNFLQEKSCKKSYHKKAYCKSCKTCCWLALACASAYEPLCASMLYFEKVALSAAKSTSRIVLSADLTFTWVTVMLLSVD